MSRGDRTKQVNIRDGPLPDNLPFTLCAGCGQVMNLIRAVPSLGMIAELHVFVCPACGEAETKRVLRPSL